MSSLRPPQPSYVFRGHKAAIHVLLFLESNSELLSGDSDGFVVLWSLATKRPILVWKAHEGALLGVETWGPHRIITQGRDNKIRVWKLPTEDESLEEFSTTLPLDNNIDHRKKPWLEHAIDVATVNFCSFAKCVFRWDGGVPNIDLPNVLIAVSGAKDSEIEVYLLPSEEKWAVIPAPPAMKDKTGMVMALKIVQPSDDSPLVIAGYESGAVYVFKSDPEVQKWKEIYTSQAHSQPVLSIDVSPSLDVFFSSGADAVVARYSLSEKMQEAPKISSTRHSGQQGLQVRSDGKILATAGWDSRVRVYSAKTLKELAVLKWHKEGCYSVAFAEVDSLKPSHSTQNGTTAETALVTQNPETSQRTVREARNTYVQSTHWLAAGSKDGRISLWDIY